MYSIDIILTAIDNIGPRKHAWLAENNSKVHHQRPID
jgi:hypothetical protein